MNTMEETRKFLESIGQPGGDLYTLPDSDKRFDDGCQYRFEVPGILGNERVEVLASNAQASAATEEGAIRVSFDRARSYVLLKIGE